MWLRNAENEKKITALMAAMTLEEKTGQLVQLGPSLVGSFELPLEELMDMVSDGRMTQEELYETISNSRFGFPLEDIEAGKVGSCNGAVGAEALTEAQEAAGRSRTQIPLLLGADVIHGFMTTYPIPLALSGSFEPELYQRTAEMAADEASAMGIHWTFAPMLDVARDPRWGRISEGAGEDPYLTSVFAKHTIMGFQGDNPGDGKHLLACAKHFAAYGGAEAGRDYNSSDLSPQKLREVYFPPFKAAVQAGVGSIMPAFNDISGVPCTVNKELLTDILRNEWGFKGLVISDANAIAECVNHGVASDGVDAAKKAIEAGVDMDMASGSYGGNLKTLVDSGELMVSEIDRAVRNVLRVKFALGLMGRGSQIDEKRIKSTILKPEYLMLAKEAAQKSIVLLKNEKGALPLEKDKKIALIGRLAAQKDQMLGAWASIGAGGCITVAEALKAEKCDYTYAEGLTKDNKIDEAAISEACQDKDVIVLAIGERVEESGEAASRGDLSIHSEDKELLRYLKGLGKPIVLLLFNGRPLVLTEESELSDAILECWHLGSQAGNAITDVLYGRYNPSARITATFPAALGQCPIYYNHMNTGRPTGKSKYTSRYIDIPTDPLYPFGFGLSYTTFSYEDLQASIAAESFHVQVCVTNTGTLSGEEVVQIYLQDVVADRARPVKELKAFKKVKLEPGEKEKLTFDIPIEEMSYYDRNMTRRIDEGLFRVYAGGNSRDTLMCEIGLETGRIYEEPILKGM